MRTMPSASPMRGQDCPYHLVRHRLLSRMLLPVRARGIQAGGLSGSQDAAHGGYQRANEEYGDGGEIPELPESCLHKAQRTPKIPKHTLRTGESLVAIVLRTLRGHLDFSDERSSIGRPPCPSIAIPRPSSTVSSRCCLARSWPRLRCMRRSRWISATKSRAAPAR